MQLCQYLTQRSGNKTFTVFGALHFSIFGPTGPLRLMTKSIGVGEMPLTHSTFAIVSCARTTPPASLPLQLPNLRRFFLQGYQGDKKNPGLSC